MNNRFNEFVESLKRLYDRQRLSKEKIDTLLKEKKITMEEHLYILGGN
jgi:hypothetical protein